MFFKLTIIAFALVATVQAFDFSSTGGKETINGCAKKNKVRDVKKALLPGSKDPNAKCLKHCIALKSKLIQENGEPILDDAPQDHNITKYIQACSKEHREADKCERVNQISNCVKDKTDKLMQMFSNECAQKTKTRVNNYLDLAKTPFKSVYNSKLYCYFHCMMMKIEAMDAEANIATDKLKPILAGFKFENVIDEVKTCSKKNKQKDVCTRAAQRVICVGTKYVVGNLFG